MVQRIIEKRIATKVEEKRMTELIISYLYMAYHKGEIGNPLRPDELAKEVWNQIRDLIEV